MTPRESFRFAFLARCAEEGLTEAETAARIEKVAAHIKLGNPYWNALKELFNVGRGAVGLGVDTGWQGGLAATGLGVGSGLLGGHLLAKAQDPNYDTDEIHRQELISTYEDLADRMEDDDPTGRPQTPGMR